MCYKCQNVLQEADSNLEIRAQKILGNVCVIHPAGVGLGERTQAWADREVGLWHSPPWETLKPRCPFRMVHTRPLGSPTHCHPSSVWDAQAGSLT